MSQRFPGQKEGETIKHLIRKHWIIYVKLLLFMGLTVGLPFLIYLWLEMGFGFAENTKRWFTLCFLIYLQIIALVTFIRWLEEELDIIIVTNERVISIDQLTFMHRTISETELTQIQDVKHIAKGVLSNVFGFGSLEIQTAAEKIVFHIEEIPEPFKMARKIMDLRDTYKRQFMHSPHDTLDGVARQDRGEAGHII